MAVLLKDVSNSLIYTLPDGLELIEEPWERRVEIEIRAYSHGGVVTGDEKIEERFLLVSGVYYSATEPNLKSLKKACNTAGLRLYATQNSNEFYGVKCKSFMTSYGKELMTTKVEVIIEFVCPDPFRYYKDETTDNETGITSSPHAYTVDNGGDEEVFPVITFTGGTSTNLTKIRIANAEDGGKWFEVETAIGDGDVIVIDCQEGTVKKNGSGIISSFTRAFINLASGTNNITITMTGTVGTVSCQMVFRKRYL